MQKRCKQRGGCSSNSKSKLPEGLVAAGAGLGDEGAVERLFNGFGAEGREFETAVTVAVAVGGIGDVNGPTCWCIAVWGRARAQCDCYEIG